MKTEAEKIMDNLIQLAELLDEETLQNAASIRFIDLARSVSLSSPRKPRRPRHRGQNRKVLGKVPTLE